MPFRDRDPLRIGLVGLVVIAAVTVLAFNLRSLAGGATYSAAFSEAGGLKPGEEVRIAGVKVGEVTAVDLVNDHVRVKFTSSAPFGTQSRAEIKIKTLLGSHYLAIDPAGPGRTPHGRQIPLSRTTAPYDVVPALQDASAQLGQIDTAQLARSFNVLSQTMQGSPENIRRSLAGLQKVSRAIASRDTELGELLRHSKNVTSLLADRSGDLAVLVRDGGLLLQEINARRVVINRLLTGTVALSQQVTGAIQENQGTLNPALTNLRRLIAVLRRNQGNLERSLQTLGPFMTQASDATGSGRWFDIYVQNLVPIPASVRQGDDGTLPIFQ